MAQRESFVFYKSFYEAIKDLDNEVRLEVYDSIAKYSLYHKEPKMSKIGKSIFALIKPQIDANYRKYLNGTKPKQTRSKQEANDKQSESKVVANVNDNVNVNVNDNVNVNVNGKMKAKSNHDEVLEVYPSDMSLILTEERKQELIERRKHG